MVMNEPYFVDSTPRLAFERDGTGPLVIFLHGIGGNRTNWNAQRAALNDRFTAIAWDARGYGLSDDYPGELKFSDFADDLARLMDWLSIERAHLVGLSMGGRILLDFQPRHPTRVATLTLCDTHFGFQTALTPQKREEFIRLRQQPLLEGKTFADLAPTLISSLVGPNCSAEATAELHRSILALHKESYLKTIAASVHFEASGDLGAIKVPVQLIYGEHDRLTPSSIGQEMLHLIRDARLNVIPDAGHLSNLEQPAAFNTVLAGFLDEHAELASTLEG